jgi:hypothetical protein
MKGIVRNLGPIQQRRRGLVKNLKTHSIKISQNLKPIQQKRVVGYLFNIDAKEW